jgi:hypothetical protein
MTSIFMKKLIFFFLQHLTDETISNRETFASDSDDLAMTCDEDPQESGAAVHEDDGNSVRETWFSKMLRDLTLCRLATRLRSYDYCVSICQSWLSELSAKNVTGAIAVAFGCFDCVSQLRKRKPDRSLLSSQVLMSLTFNDAGQPINNAVSLVLKGGEALCYAWNQDYAQSLSSFDMACKCAKDAHVAARDINAAALIQSFDRMAKLVCKAAEIKHRSLIDKYKIEANEPVQTFASGDSQPSSSDTLTANVDLGLNVKKVDAGWMIVKVH